VSSVPGAFGTAQQHALDWLRQLIVAGEFRPGQRVNQEALAERIGLSVAPVREALRVLEKEGQVTYLPRRGYYVTELRIEDLREIYELRRILEERAVRAGVPGLDDEALGRIREAAADCANAVDGGDVASELAANRRFHFAMLEVPSQPHTVRLIHLLWESTEAYRALYYNSPDERVATIDAHDRILDALLSRDIDRLVVELDEHRQRALDVLSSILEP
jgi:DNA-binding GntR family transcriptional regulator